MSVSVNPVLQQQYMRQAGALAGQCASCGGGGCSCGGGGGGVSGASIIKAAQNGQDPRAAFEQLKSQQYNKIMAHEQAHASAAGSFGGGINIQYGPGGIAVSGDVPVSMPALDPKNPASTIQAAQTVKAAALAPSDPSGQDMSVAAKAQGIMGQAQVLMQNPQLQQKTNLNGMSPIK